MTHQAIGPSVEWRQPLYAGVLGCLGVGLAWLLWVAVHAFAKSSWQVLVAPVVGAVVGMAMEFFRHHWLVSAREARERPADAPAISEAIRQRVREEPAYAERSVGWALAGIVASAFLLGVCSNLVGDLMMRLVKPFLTTLALFFPIGVWLGYVFHARVKFSTFPEHLVRGSLAGAGAAGIAFAVSMLLGIVELTVPSLLGLLGWWVLLGLGWGLAYSDCDGPKPFAPIVGTALATLFVLSSTAPNTSSGSIWGTLRYVTDPLSSYALAQPGLPSRFFEEAARELNAAASTVVAPVPVPEPVPVPVPPSRIAPERAAPEPAPATGALVLRRLPVASSRPEAFGSASIDQRARLVDAQLALGLKSELARSWLVIALFSAAVGLGRWTEARLRPLDYGRSETRRNDLFLTLGAAAVWITALLYVAISGW